MRELSGLLTLILLLGLAALFALPTAAPYLPFLGIPLPQRSTVERSVVAASLSGEFTLAVSWQPAFCETAPRKPECQSQTADRFDADHFTLHGLWPDPAGNIYCDVSQRLRSADEASRWQVLPEPELGDGLKRRLDTRMPGTVSNLHRHEWIKHGTCSGGDAQAYYAVSLALLDALNDTNIRDLFAGNIGGELTAARIRSAFDRAFGEGTGQRVQIECETDDDRRLISELRISLDGEIGRAPDLGALMLAADTRSRGCPVGMIDRVGLQ